MSERLPKHIAIILDGNGRWAEARGRERTEGHQAGAAAVPRAVNACRERGIENLTLYAFSQANWSRPQEEIDALMRICAEFAEDHREELIARGVRVEVVGEIDDAPARTRRAVERLIDDTRHNGAMRLALAISYGGRRDVVNAIKALMVRARAGLVLPEEIDEANVRRFLTTSAMPDVDLVIRTGGERRLSDFLLFESAYAELFFTDTFWPDFTDKTLDEALASFSKRRRRYGKTDAQIAL